MQLQWFSVQDVALRYCDFVSIAGGHSANFFFYLFFHLGYVAHTHYFQMSFLCPAFSAPYSLRDFHWAQIAYMHTLGVEILFSSGRYVVGLGIVGCIGVYNGLCCFIGGCMASCIVSPHSEHAWRFGVFVHASGPRGRRLPQIGVHCSKGRRARWSSQGG